MINNFFNRYKKHIRNNIFIYVCIGVLVLLQGCQKPEESCKGVVPNLIGKSEREAIKIVKEQNLVWEEDCSSNNTLDTDKGYGTVGWQEQKEIATGKFVSIGETVDCNSTLIKFCIVKELDLTPTHTTTPVPTPATPTDTPSPTDTPVTPIDTPTAAISQPADLVLPKSLVYFTDDNADGLVYNERQPNGETRVLSFPGRQAALSQDRTRLAYVTHDGTQLWQISLGNGQNANEEPTLIAEMPSGTSVSPDGPLAWSYNNQWLAFTSNITDVARVLTVVATVQNDEQSDPIFVANTGEYYQMVNHLDWAPQANVLLFDGSNGDTSGIYVGTIDTENEHMEVRFFDTLPYHTPVWSPDMRYMIVQSDTEVLIVTGKTLEVSQTFDNAKCAHWHPQGNYVIMQKDNQIHIARVGDDGEPKSLDIGVSGDCQAYTWSPDEHYLAYIQQDSSQLTIVQLDDEMNAIHTEPITETGILAVLWK